MGHVVGRYPCWSFTGLDVGSLGGYATDIVRGRVFTPSTPNRLKSLPGPSVLHHPAVHHRTRDADTLRNAFRPLRAILTRSCRINRSGDKLDRSVHRILGCLSTTRYNVNRVRSKRPVDLRSHTQVTRTSYRKRRIQRSANLKCAVRPDIRQPARTTRQKYTFHTRTSKTGQTITNTITSSRPEPTRPTTTIHVPIIQTPSAQVSKRLTQYFRREKLKQLSAILLPERQKVLQKHTTTHRTSYRYTTRMSRSVK